MSAHRTSEAELRLLSRNGDQAADNLTHKAEKTGGPGLDFGEISPDIPEDSIAEEEWNRLAAVYANQPTRFREADRSLLTMWCIWSQVFSEASADLLANGQLVAGRSKDDKGRQVRNPAFVNVTQASNQLQMIGKELGFSPASRSRAGITEEEPKSKVWDNSDLLSG